MLDKGVGRLERIEGGNKDKSFSFSSTLKYIQKKKKKRKKLLLNAQGLMVIFIREGGGEEEEGDSGSAVKADGWRWIITSFKADVYFSLSLSSVLYIYFFSSLRFSPNEGPCYSWVNGEWVVGLKSWW